MENPPKGNAVNAEATDREENGARPANPLIEMMARSAGFEDVDRFVNDFAETKNSQHAESFARVPFSRRILLLPQCLRSSGNCQAQERGVFYECVCCGACGIPGIIEMADELGYMGVYILKGGRAVERLIKDLDPGAVAGVACNYEGFIGIMECERRGIPVRFVRLSRDGCADTEVDLEGLRRQLARTAEES